MLSKGLLSEVLGEDYEILKITKHFVTIRHEEAFNSVEWCEHKVAHICKEWAWNYNKSFITVYKTPSQYKAVVTQLHKKKLVECEIVLGKEPEAIFKACQWVLKNKDK